MLAVEREVEFHLALVALQQGAPIIEVRKSLIEHWGWLPTHRKLFQLVTPNDLEKRDEDATIPGDHGIPEIGNAEEAFFASLTAGQKDALADLQRLVDMLYEQHRGFENIDPYSADEAVDAWKSHALFELATHPTSAFLLGQLFATEALNAAVHMPINPQDRRAINYLTQYSLNEISSKFDELKSEIRNQLIGAIAEGRNPRDVSRSLANVFHEYSTDWATIAITETARAESQGRLQEYDDQEIEYVMGSTAHDTRACDWCLNNIDGKKYALKEVINKSNYGRKKDSWGPYIPVHPRCRCVWLPA